MPKDLLFNLFVRTALQNTPRLYTGGKKGIFMYVYTKRN